LATILIVEDEQDMALGLKDNFEFDGHTVYLAENGEKGLTMALNNNPDLIILDVMLPKKSGFDVCKELREKGNKTPVIMLTARGQEIDKVLGLELGADDYMTKPFSVRELLARVKAVLRRFSETEAKEKAPEIIQFGKLSIDFNRYTAYLNEKEIALSAKEFEILKYFYENKDRVIGRDELLNKVWGYEYYPTTRTVDNFIVKLRKRIEEDPDNPK
jgi:DNA-binding response OmpR family regulator